jgi:hypothetical protein
MSSIPITITPSPLELGIHADEWEAVCEDLRASGFAPVIEPPIEKRDVGQVVMETLITVGASKALDVVVDALGRHLRDRRKHRAPVVIYGPDGEVWRVVKLPKEP